MGAVEDVAVWREMRPVAGPAPSSVRRNSIISRFQTHKCSQFCPEWRANILNDLAADAPTRGGGGVTTVSLRRWVGLQPIRRIAVLALCVCLAATPCKAEGANAAGFGLTSCADAAPLFDQWAYRQAFFTWTMGFATGINNVLVVRDRQFRDVSGLNADLVVGSLRAFCAQYPTAFLIQGAERFHAGLPLRAWTAPR